MGRNRDYGGAAQYGDRALIPLCVDLDGTLIKTDVLWESTARLFRQKPWLVFALPVWLASGKAALKRRIAQEVAVDASLLPYDREFLAWIRGQKLEGRKLVLATASDQLLANDIERHLGIFDEVLGSDGRHNMKGAGKLARLSRDYGSAFAYAGNSHADLPIWSGCQEAIVVNADDRVLEQARKLGNVTRVFEQQRVTGEMIVDALRVRRWWKNLLIFAGPLLMLHAPAWWTIPLAFMAWNLCASGVYVLDDLLDLEPDRRDPLRARQPIASGSIPMMIAFAAWPALLAAGFVLTLALPPAFTGVLAVYVVFGVLYSLAGGKSHRTALLFLALRVLAGWLAWR